MRISIGVPVLGLLLLLAACAAEIKKPNADVLLAKEGFSAIERLRDAYVRESPDDMRAECTKSGFEEIQSRRGRLTASELEFTPKWVEVIGQDAMRVTVSWRGAWDVEQDGARSRVEQTGIAVFRLSGKPLKVDGLERGNPFAAPVEGGIRP